MQNNVLGWEVRILKNRFSKQTVCSVTDLVGFPFFFQIVRDLI